MKYKSERNIQALIQIELSKHGVIPFRNNVGAYTSEAGHRVSFGVGGRGGSDLICITPVTITPDMVGKTIGVFTAIEVKTEKGKASDWQKKFIASVQRVGGFSGIARSPDDALTIAKIK